MHPKPENTAKKQKTARWLTDAVFYLAILFFIIGFNFSDRMAGNWYQQFMPNIGSRSIQDVFFLDSLTGWAVTNATNQNPDTTFVLKTINGGDTWSIFYRKVQTGGGFSGYFKVYFLDQNTGYVTDVRGIYKTTDGGLNWTSLNAPLNAYLDMSVLSKDTVWIVTPESLTGGVYRTTNGGASWQNQLNLGSQNPSKIYMYNARIGFFSSTAGLHKTTNSGLNWLNVSNDFSFSDMFFVDSLTGWKASGFIKKTTDGGLNWTNQPIPEGGNILGNGAIRFMNKDDDTIWAVGETLITGGNPLTRGILFRTTNGGVVWQYQLPDTAIHINRYLFGQIINNKTGWAYSFNPTGIHTTTGGDPIWVTGITQISSQIPKEFELKQNYPNPFNPRTVIPYKLKRSAFVSLIAYDITGKEIQVMVNQRQQPGEYEVDFMGKFSASGVYFYRLEVTDDKSKQLYTETKKMMLLK